MSGLPNVPARRRPRSNTGDGARPLEQSGDFLVCAEAADAAGAVEKAKKAPDVCLLDVNMPGNGIAAAAEITTALPTRSSCSPSDRRRGPLRRVARRNVGLSVEGAERARRRKSLQRVLAGEATLPGTLVARLVDEFRDREQRRVAMPKVRPLA